MAPQSLREQNKQRNFANIKRAAKHLFEQKGFEKTTTREIAEAAGIGTGTLFLYARDKAELLIMVYSDSLAEITEQAFATLSADVPLLEALIHVFSPFFHFYEQHPENARHFLKELLFHPGEQAYHQLFSRQNQELVARIAQLVERAQARGEVRQDVEPFQAASGFFALYFAIVTAWLGSFLLVNITSIEQLRAAFDLQIKGMLP